MILDDTFRIRLGKSRKKTFLILNQNKLVKKITKEDFFFPF